MGVPSWYIAPGVTTLETPGPPVAAETAKRVANPGDPGRVPQGAAGPPVGAWFSRGSRRGGVVVPARETKSVEKPRTMGEGLKANGSQRQFW